MFQYNDKNVQFVYKVFAYKLVPELILIHAFICSRTALVTTIGHGPIYEFCAAHTKTKLYILKSKI